MNAIYLSSPNRGGALTDYRYLMLHHTSAKDEGAATANYLCNASAQVSANFLVGTTGIVYFIVPMGIVAWHAGRGSGFGIPDNMMNNYSIGIEISNPGDGYTTYPEAQLAALDELIAYIDANMGVADIIDHKAWAPGRKDDMSANFPLAVYMSNRRHVAPEPEPVTKPPKTIVGAHEYTANQTDAQVIKIEEDGENVRLVSIIRGLCLEVMDGISDKRAPVRFAERADDKRQLWKLIPHDTGYGCLYELQTALSGEYVLDVVNGSTASGAGLQTALRNATPAQKFVLVPVPNLDAFYIVNQKSLLPIDMDNAGN